MTPRRLTARVEGLVQGVGFRFFAEERAKSLALTGWVKNEFDGSVALVAEGEPHALDALVRALESGPPTGRVDRVHVEWADGAGSFMEFSIRH